MTQTSTIKFIVNSGSMEIGVIDLSIQDLYCSVPDDLGRHLLTRDILFEGEKRGTFKVQLTLTDSSLPHLMPVPGPRRWSCREASLPERFDASTKEHVNCG